MKSIWQNIRKPDFPTLNKDIETDVLIIGGGLSGIMTAYYLNDSNLKVTLTEMNEIGSGSSGYTTGKITIFQDQVYNDLVNNFDFNKASLYLKSQIYGINLIKENIKDNNIECDFEKTDSFVFTSDENAKEKINNLKNFFDKNNIKTQTIDKLPNNFPCLYGIKGEGYVFHPLKYLYAVAGKCKADIYEHTTIKNFNKENDYYIINSDKYKIKAKKIVVATQYPFFITPGLFPFKLSTYKSYALSSLDENLYFDAISIDKPSKSIRFYQDNIIFGGNSHKTVLNINYQKQLTNLENEFNDIFALKPEYTWMTSDVKTNDFLPFIGLLTDNIYIITGFNKWGMINSTLAGKIISDLIMNNQNKFSSLFSLHRALSKEKIKSFIVDSFLITKHYIGGKIKRNKDFYNKSKIVKINGINYGMYTDKNGINHMVLNNCPHMGCPLVFNNADLTWDCPCHASKFDIEGNCLKGPSNKDIKIKNTD